jgi:hypothetical protein
MNCAMDIAMTMVICLERHNVHTCLFLTFFYKLGQNRLSFFWQLVHIK